LRCLLRGSVCDRLAAEPRSVGRHNGDVAWSRSPGSLIANSNYSCEAEIHRRNIHLSAYYVLTALHVMCAIKLLHAIRIRGADPGWHVGGLDKYMANDAGYFMPAHRVGLPAKLVGCKLKCSDSIKTTLLTPLISVNIFT
jgi:hypothetical protein